MVLVLKNEIEKKEFIKYIYENRQTFEDYVDKLKENYSYITCNNEREKREVIKRLSANKVANGLLKEFRNK